MEKPEELSDLTNKQLQEEVIKLGMPEQDAKAINTKSVLISMINTLKAKDASVVASVDKVDPGEEKRVEKTWKNKAHRQWDLWDSQPKVRIMVPLSGREKKGFIRWEFNKFLEREIPVHVSGAIQTVIENGAQFVIPKGEYLEVPQAVAKIIQDKFQQTSDAGRDLLADRMDPETGQPVSNRL